MTDHGHTGWIKGYEESKVPYLMHTINPPAGWTQDTDCYYLIMDLPNFKQDEIEVKVDALGNLIVTGTRKSGENQHVKFERHFKLPEDSDMTKPISRKLQNDMLYITVYRQLAMPNKFEFESVFKDEVGREHENRDVEGEKETKPESMEAEGEKETKPESKEGNGDDDRKEVDKRKEERNVPKKILEKLDENKCILFGILAFAFGVFVATHKLQQSPPR